jgi:hypothetical protein
MSVHEQLCAEDIKPRSLHSIDVRMHLFEIGNRTPVKSVLRHQIVPSVCIKAFKLSQPRNGKTESLQEVMQAYLSNLEASLPSS